MLARGDCERVVGDLTRDGTLERVLRPVVADEVEAREGGQRSADPVGAAELRVDAPQPLGREALPDHTRDPQRRALALRQRVEPSGHD